MPQLTLRAAVTGFLLGGVLSATNLYVAAKTGWTLGVGPHLGDPRLRHVPHPVAAGRARHDDPREQLHAVDRDGGGLHDRCRSPPGIAAYMWATNAVLPWWQIMCFNVVLSSMGVLVAFPMKRRFINDEQHPFRRAGPAASCSMHCTKRRARKSGHVQGQGAGRRGRHRRARSASSPARTSCGSCSRSGWGSQSAWHLPLDARRLVLRPGGQGPRAAAETRGRRPPAARAVAFARLRDDRRGRADGHPHRGEPARGRGAQLRRHRADHDHGRRDPAALGLGRRQARRSSAARISSTHGRCGGASR